jgi:CheY-like chemotaxis protein
MERFTTRKTQAGTGCVFMMNEAPFEGDILLCEDNQMNQALICKRLAKAGLKTTVVDNGKKGVETVVSRIQNAVKPFDLIFMDIYMPVMDGLEAAAQIIKLKTGTPIIALTASNNPYEREQYLACGMSGCVGKPFTSKEILSCLVKYLKPRAFGPVDLDTAEHSFVYQGSTEDVTEEYNRKMQGTDRKAEEKFKNKLINIFLMENKNIYNEITKAIDEGDIKLAHRLAHTIKSNAGMLEKARLQKAASNVETLLTNEENRLNQLTLNAFKDELDIVLKEFDVLMAVADSSEGEENDEIEGGSFDREKIQLIFEELEAMLDGGNLECLTTIDSLRRISRSVQPSSGKPLVDGPLVNELIQELEYFEFNAAMETLTKLYGQIQDKGEGSYG